MFEGKWLEGSKMIKFKEEINGLDSENGVIYGTGDDNFLEIYKGPYF